MTSARRLALGTAALALAAVLSLARVPGREGCVVSAVAHLSRTMRLKDRATAPRDADVDRAVVLDAMLAPGDDARRFDDTRAVELEGFVVAVQVGGWEAVNCFARDPAHRDTHIDLAMSPNAPPVARVVAEVTPRWRDAMREQGVDWSTDALRALIGRRVRVRGWLLYDGHHASGTAHSDPLDRNGETNWRATAWELHPVTAITLLR